MTWQGEEPKITAHRLAESTALLGGVFATRDVDRLGRKKYFASAKNGARHTLQPEYVYTMEFYEDKVQPGTALHSPNASDDLTSHTSLASLASSRRSIRRRLS